MKIKILDQGYEKLTGHFGSILFKDGVSVHNVSPAEVQTIAAAVTIVDAETGKQLGLSQLFVDAANAVVEAQVYKTRAQLRAEGKLQTQSTTTAAQEAQPLPAGVLTREELEAVADAKGIAGLREVADPLGAKGKSIAALIEAILKAQGKIAAAPAPQEPEAPAGEDERQEQEPEIPAGEDAGQSQE